MCKALKGRLGVLEKAINIQSLLQGSEFLDDPSLSCGDAFDIQAVQALPASRQPWFQLIVCSPLMDSASPMTRLVGAWELVDRLVRFYSGINTHSLEKV